MDEKAINKAIEKALEEAKEKGIVDKIIGIDCDLSDFL